MSVDNAVNSPRGVGNIRVDSTSSSGTALDYDEVFLSSTGGGVLPIAKVDGRPLRTFPGPITRRLHDAYWALHDDPRFRDPVAY